MDIASVYLNLASLLGAEIEVEGYYEWGRLYAYEEGDRESLRIVLSSYIHEEVLPIDDRNVFPRIRSKVSFKGILKQNAHGDPAMSEITAISCVTSEETYHAILVHMPNFVICNLHAELNLSQDEQLNAYHAVEKLTYASRITSMPVILEGYLEGPRRGFSLSARNLVSNLVDYLAQVVGIAAYSMFIGLSNLFYSSDDKSKVRSELGVVRDKWQSYYKSVFISFSPKESEYFEKRFGTRLGGRGPRLGSAKFAIYGQIEFFSPQERKLMSVKKPYQLKFTSINHITIRKTISFDRPQDE